MTTLTIAAAELSRIVRAVEKSAAKDDSRPVLAGVHAAITGDTLTLSAADGYRLSTAHATLDDAAETPATAILERAGLLAFAKSLKPKTSPRATIETDAAAWTFAANGARASVRLIDGTFPDVSGIIGSGSEPVLFTVNPTYFASVLASHGTDPVHVSRADDDARSPLFFTAGDGTRHVVMPMVIGADAPAWKRPAAAEPVTEHAPEVEPAPAPVTPDESAYRTRADAAERRDAKRAERRASALPRCAECDLLAEPGDNFCGTCGTPLGEPAEVLAAGAHTWPAPVAVAPVTTPAALASFSAPNQQRILDACPHASEVRNFHGWLKAGRVVRKGQKGIRIVAPVLSDDGSKVTTIRHTHVFDVSQTDELTRRESRAAA